MGTGTGAQWRMSDDELHRRELRRRGTNGDKQRSSGCHGRAGRHGRVGPGPSRSNKDPLGRPVVPNPSPPSMTATLTAAHGRPLRGAREALRGHERVFCGRESSDCARAWAARCYDCCCVLPVGPHTWSHISCMDRGTRRCTRGEGPVKRWEASIFVCLLTRSNCLELLTAIW